MRKDHPRPPESVDSLVRDEVADMIAARFPHRGESDLDMTVMAPIPVLHLGLDALQNGAGLDAGTDAGWRFIIIVSGRPVALADAGLNRDGRAELRQVNYGPYVESLYASQERARAAVDRRGGAVELLSAPALYLLALWHDADEGEGTVTVLAPAAPPFEAGVPYGEAEFFDRLTEVARAVSVPVGGEGDEPEDVAGLRGNARP